MDDGIFFIAVLALAAGVFTFFSFIDLMRRHDDEFPGQYDKPIWAVAIMFGTVIGAFAYWFTRPPAPTSNETLRHQYGPGSKEQ